MSPTNKPFCEVDQVEEGPGLSHKRASLVQFQKIKRSF